MQKILKISSATAGKKLSSFLNKTRKELDVFFRCSINDPLIFFLKKRLEMDLVEYKKTEKWVAATTRRGAIYIFDPKVFSSVTTHAKEEFWQILKHELVHLYSGKVTKGTRPIWLSEGLACFLAGQAKELSNEQKEKIFDVFSFYDHGGKGVYSLGTFWVGVLMKKFGVKKMRTLLYSLSDVSDEKGFSRAFKRVYGFFPNKKGFSKMI